MSAGFMFGGPGQGNPAEVESALLQEAAASKSAAPAFNYLRFCAEKAESTLLAGLGHFDMEALSVTRRQHFGDINSIARSMAAENAAHSLSSEQRAQLASVQAAMLRALPAATLAVEAGRVRSAAPNAPAPPAAPAAAPTATQPVSQDVPDAQFQEVRALAESTVRASLGLGAQSSLSSRSILAAAAEAEGRERALARGTHRRQLMILAQLYLRLLAIVESERCHNPSVGDELLRLASEEFSRAELDGNLPVPDPFDRARVNAAIGAASAVSLAMPVVTPPKSKQQHQHYRRNNSSFQNGGDYSNNNNNNGKKNKKRPREDQGDKSSGKKKRNDPP